MSRESGLRLATLTAGFARGAASDVAADWAAEADPDAVIPVGGAGASARQFVARYLDGAVPVMDPAESGAQLEGWNVAVAGSAAALSRALATAGDGSAADALPEVVVTDALGLHVDPTALSTTIEGREALDALEGSRPQDVSRVGAPVVISTGLPAGYRNRVAGARVLGVGDADETGPGALSILELREGRVLVETLSEDRLGLQAVREVGATRAGTLRRAGFDTRGAVAEAPLAELRDLDGFGESVSSTIHASARAIANGQVVRQSREPVPVADPLFVDIETDGLHPTVTWLVGVLDGGPSTGTYHSFLARDPADPGAAIEAFLEWYADSARGRTLVAYNGHSFDFPVLEEHAQDLRPELAPVFESADRFDPYRFAVTDGNALLPGRTNRLEDVAAGLGHESATSGYTGAAVARAYRRWMTDPVPANEPDWERLDAYCEDDVRALARVFEALEGAASTGGSPAREPARQRTETTQGTLSEW